MKKDYRYLVVDGIINTAPSSTTTFTLSRTRNLGDTVIFQTEKLAQVYIENTTGNTYQLFEQSDGRYELGNLTLNPSDKYRLKIYTSDGAQYLSDFVASNNTPAIDSITWQQDNDVTIFANTHDPQNSSRYYRWYYEETWEDHTKLTSVWIYKGGQILLREPDEETFQCWKTLSSTDILLGTSIKLTNDIIDHAPILKIKQHDERILIRYSILVKQYALTEDAYRYWEILQKNTQQQGSLFDPQPGQLKGNIHNTKNPNEPVIGYVSASSIQTKRLFINNNEVSSWEDIRPSFCDVKLISRSTTDYIEWFEHNPYSPYYFSGMSLYIARNECLDCRLSGGVLKKPSFW